MASIDERIVSLKFNADQFSDNVNKSLSLLDKLKEKLHLKDAGKGISDVTNSVNKIDFGPITSGIDRVKEGFSTLAIAAGTAIGNIASNLINTLGGALNAISFQPIKDGFAEYELGLNSVQTILNNTKSKGEDINTVNAALKQLNEYADQTIYSFSDMTKNASLFTAAGVGLKDSTAAIKGLSQFAAVAGVNSQEASRAMFQMSQAIASGTIKLQDWMSVENAGMGGEQFQEALKRTARAHGKHVDELIAKEGSFRASLSKGWLDSSIMLETLSQMAGEYNDEQLASMGYTEEQIAQIKELAATGMDAATKIKTFSQLIDVIKEEMGSGWAETWQIIMGDFTEAGELWTEVGGAITGVFKNMSNARNNMLQGWKDLGGRTELIRALIDTVKGLVPLFSAVGKAWSEVFPPLSSEGLLKITHGFSEFIQKLVPSQETISKVGRVFKGVFSILHIGVTIVSSIAGVFGKVFSAFSSGSGGVLSFAATLGDLAVRLDQFLTGSGRLQNFIGGFGTVVSGVIRSVISFVGGIVSSISNWAKSVDLIDRMKAAWSGFADSMSGVRAAFDKVLGVFTRYDQSLAVAQAAGNGASFVVDKLKSALTGLWNILQKVAPYIKSAFDKIFEVVGKIASGMSLDGILKSLFTVGGLALVHKFMGVLGGIQGVLDKFKNQEKTPGIIDHIKDAFSSLTDSLSEMQSTLKVTQLMLIAIAIGILTASVYTLSKIPASSLLKATGAISVMLGQLTISLLAFSNIIEKYDTSGLAKVAFGLILIAVAVRILAGAVKSMSGIEWKGLVKGLGSVLLLLAGITVAMRFMDSKTGSSIRAATAMILIAYAIRVLAKAVDKFGEMDWKKLAKGLLSVGLLLAGITLAMKFAGTGPSMAGALAIVAIAVAIKMLVSPIEKLGNMPWKQLVKGFGAVVVILAAIAAFSNFSGGAMGLLSAAGLVIIAYGIGMIADVVKDLGKQNWQTLAKGLLSMGLALLAVGAFMALVPPTGIIAAAGLVATAYALKIIGDVLIDWGKMSWTEIGKSMVMLAGTLLILGLAITAMAFALPGALALVVIAASLLLLAPVLKSFSGMSWNEIAKGLLMLAGTLAIFVIAGYAVSPVIGPLMLLAAAISLIGLATLMAGAGVLMFAAGIGALVAVGAAGLEVLAGVLTTIANAIPEFATKVAEGLVNFSTELANNTETLKANFVTIVSSMIQGAIELLPQFTELAITIITCLCTAAQACIPLMIDTGWSIIIAFLTAMRDNIGQATDIGIDIVLNFLAAVTARLPDIVQAGWNLVIGFIDSMTEGLRNNGPRLRRSIREFVKEFIHQGKLALEEEVENVKRKASNIGNAMIDGIKNAINNGIESVKSTARSMATSAYNAAKAALGIKSPSRKFRDVGRFVIAGFVQGIDNNAELAEESSRQAAINSLDAFQKVVDDKGLNDSSIHSPTIRPVMDLQDVEDGRRKVGQLFASGVSVKGWADYTRRTSDLAGWGVRDGDARLLTTRLLNEALAKRLSDETQPAAPIQFIQNNTSPKELSAIDIYRQTQNQLSMARRALSS
nr:MAG TPA: tail tape measure [Caudoviricetes sp.]